MLNWTKATAKTTRVRVLLFDGFSNLCLANCVEPMRAANMLSGKPLYDWQVLSMTGEQVTSSSGLQIAPNGALTGVGGQMLLVMPSYGFREHSGWAVQAGLRAAATRFETIAGLDTGAWLMAEAGLLHGRVATIHWEELTSFAERFPDIEVHRERFVLDRERITCSGALAAFDLMHHLIGETHGQALALEVAQLLMSHTQGRAHGPKESDKAVAVMEANLENPLPIAEIALRSGQTQKSLEKRMREIYGASPRTIYRRLRLNLARKLVREEAALSVSEIALRCGYENPSALTRAFRAEFGTTLRDLRRASR